MSDRDRTFRPPLGAAFWRIWATQTMSIVGSTLSGVGVAVYVYVATGDARWLGVLAALSAVPYLLVAPLLGRLDRFTRRSMLVVGDCLAAVGPVVALAIAAVGRLEVWHLAVAGFLTGVGNAVQTPASNAVVPALVPGADAERLARANGLFQIGPAAGIVFGPALATPLVAWWGVEAVLVVDVVTFAIAVATTATTRFAESPVVDARATGADDGSWTVAVKWLRGPGRALLVLLVAMGAVNFLLAFFNVALLAVATDVGGPALAGTAVALGGVAMILGSLATGVVGVARRPVRLFGWALATTGAGAVVASLRPSFSLVVVGVVIALAPVTLVNAGVATLFQTRVPATMHGRVFAVRSSIARSLDPVGAALAGFVIADVAAPTMVDGGVGAGVFGRVVSVGAERGAALVLLWVGLGLIGVAAWIRASGRIRELDGPLPPVGVAAAVTVDQRSMGATEVARA